MGGTRSVLLACLNVQGCQNESRSIRSPGLIGPDINYLWEFNNSGLILILAQSIPIQKLVCAKWSVPQWARSACWPNSFFFIIIEVINDKSNIFF